MNRDSLSLGDARCSRPVNCRVGPPKIHPTPIEVKLLAFLVKHACKVLTHPQALKEVWGPAHAHDAQYLRVNASQLRQKLDVTAAQRQLALTQPGVGY